MQIDNEFLQSNFQYFQEWHHWHDKAISLRKTAIVLYRNSIPELRKYDKAYRVAQKELKLKKRIVVPIRYPHPDVLPAFSIYGSALENAFKGIMVSKDKNLSARRAFRRAWKGIISSSWPTALVWLCHPKKNTCCTRS